MILAKTADFDDLLLLIDLDETPLHVVFRLPMALRKLVQH